MALGIQTVGAQSGQANGAANGFRISPVRSELTIQKGKSQSITITVENPTGVSTVVRAVVNDFVASDDESGTPRLILDENAPKPKNDFEGLVNKIPDVELGPQQKKDIAVKISVPANANAGGYYGAIRFVPANTNVQQLNVGLTASVGTIVLVTVPGDLKESVNLLEIAASQNGKAKGFITSGDVGVITRLKNEGDIHVKPFGRVQVKSMFGKTVASYEFNSTDPRSNLLPDSVRRFDNELPKGTKWFGRYTIEANLGYSQGSGNLIIAKATFWYIPTWALYALGGLLLAIIVGAYLLYRKFSAKGPRKDK
jgi:hypothetical protein